VDPHHFDADPDVGPTYQSHADRNSSYGIRIPDKDIFNLGFLLASKNVKPPVKEQTEGPNYYGKQFRIVFMFNDAPPPSRYSTDSVPIDCLDEKNNNLKIQNISQRHQSAQMD